jgi:hypothetical protein
MYPRHFSPHFDLAFVYAVCPNIQKSTFAAPSMLCPSFSSPFFALFLFVPRNAFVLSRITFLSQSAPRPQRL